MTLIDCIADESIQCLTEYFLENPQEIKNDLYILEACNYNAYKSVKLLIELGANINAKTDKGVTCLMHTPLDFKITELLILNGADVNTRSITGNTALMYKCMRSNYETYKTIKFLIQNGAHINARDSRGYTALMYLCEGDFEYVSYSVRFLLKNGAYVNVISKDYRTVYNLSKFETKDFLLRIKGSKIDTRSSKLIKEQMFHALMNKRDPTGTYDILMKQGFIE